MVLDRLASLRVPLQLCNEDSRKPYMNVKIHILFTYIDIRM